MVPEYTPIFTGDLCDMKDELRMIIHQADADTKQYIKEMLNIMYNYDVSPYSYEDLMNGCTY